MSSAAVAVTVVVVCLVGIGFALIVRGFLDRIDPQ